MGRTLPHSDGKCATFCGGVPLSAAACSACLGQARLILPRTQNAPPVKVRMNGIRAGFRPTAEARQEKGPRL